MSIELPSRINPETLSLQVLVVDDDPDINRLLTIRLQTRGHHVVSVASAEEALDYLTAYPVDLLFLDVSLPKMSGLELLSHIRKQDPNMAVIMTTAFGSEQVAIEALRLGADDYLRKPFDSSDFRSVLHHTTKRLQLSRQNAELRRQLERKNRQLEAELANAADIQAQLLPITMPKMQGFDLAAECVPAFEVGGDFYDWQMPQPQLLSFWLCDVMGKGMPAALLMATVRAVMRAEVRDSSPADALRYVTKTLADDFARTDSFVTLFLAQLNLKTRQILFVDAGHGYAFVRRADGQAQYLQPRGLPMGTMPDIIYREGTLTLNPGDALILYSDGIVDTRPDLVVNPDMLAQQLNGTTSALAMVDRIIELIGPNTKPPDDITTIILRCHDIVPDSTN